MEQPHDYEIVLARLPAHNLIVTRESDIKKLLPQTRLLITSYSTSIVEAMFFGTLVLTLDFENNLAGMDIFSVKSQRSRSQSALGS